MKTAFFAMESLGENIFKGYMQGSIWNGWDCLLFPFEGEKRVVEGYEEQSHTASFDQENDGFRFMSEKSAEVEVVGGNLYEIGASVDLGIGSESGKVRGSNSSMKIVTKRAVTRAV